MDANFARRLRGREPLAGTLLSLPSPELAEICAEAGFDWLFLDMEHGLIDAEDLQRMIQAVAGRSACVVRVSEPAEAAVRRALDSGADGLIVPHVCSADDAERAVRWAKYPPRGVRSMGFTRANRWGAGFEGHVEAADRDVVVVAQVEHVDGVRSIRGILEVPGVDGVFVGPYDLSASLGRPGSTGDPDVRAAIAEVAAACDARGTPRGIFARDGETARAARRDGFAFVCAGLDTAVFGAAARSLLAGLRG